MGYRNNPLLSQHENTGDNSSYGSTAGNDSKADVVSRLSQQNVGLVLLLEALKASEKQYRTLVENSPDIIYCCDTKGHLTYANAKFYEATGLSADKVLGIGVFDIPGLKNYTYVWKKIFKEIRKDAQLKKLEIEMAMQDGMPHTLAVFLFPILDTSGKVTGINCTTHDITENKKNENLMGYLAYHDLLTDLPNRLLFLDRLNIAIQHATRTHTQLAVIFLDLDNFKKINDTLGHSVGDTLIKMVGGELKRVLRKDETLARLGGDEFTILIQGVDTKEKIIHFIERIKAVFNGSYEVENSAIHISPSIGISIFPDDGRNADELIKNADAAMYKAKELGKNNYQFYCSNMRSEVFKRLVIEGYLAKALENDELSLSYQPQIDTYSGQIRGFEALLRWNNPKMGSIMPKDFIPIAEETGLILHINEWVLRTACKKNKAWFDQYGVRNIISVNIPAIQLKQRNFSALVQEILNETGMPADCLELEITDSILFDSLSTITGILNELKSTGIRISLGGFGIGFSSLNYLKKFPLDAVKIGKTFIEDIQSSTAEREIIETIISLVHKLNLKIVVEGVETKEQFIYLMEAKCDYVQGNLIYKPDSDQNILKLLGKNKISLLRILENRLDGQYI